MAPDRVIVSRWWGRGSAERKGRNKKKRKNHLQAYYKEEGTRKDLKGGGAKRKFPGGTGWIARSFSKRGTEEISGPAW